MISAPLVDLFSNVTVPLDYLKASRPGLVLAPFAVAIFFIFLAVSGDDTTSFRIYAATALFFLFVAVLLMLGRPQIDLSYALALLRQR
jgi:hypothetical protein